jgi:hypothetical protein
MTKIYTIHTRIPSLSKYIYPPNLLLPLPRYHHNTKVKPEKNTTLIRIRYATPKNSPQVYAPNVKSRAIGSTKKVIITARLENVQ